MSITPIGSVAPTAIATGLVMALTITPSEFTATIVAIGALVTALGTAIVNILAARAQTKEIRAAAEKIEEVKQKTEVIGGHVNSSATKAAEQINALQAELKNMREQMADKDVIAKLLAQAAAMSGSPGPAVALTDSPAATEKLTSIDDNTKAIEKNTASTEKKVKDIQATEKKKG